MHIYSKNHFVDWVNRKTNKKIGSLVPADPNLSDFLKSAYPVFKVEDPELLEKLSKDQLLNASVERAKAFIAKHGLPKDEDWNKVK